MITWPHFVPRKDNGDLPDVNIPYHVVFWQTKERMDGYRHFHTECSRGELGNGISLRRFYAPCSDKMSQVCRRTVKAKDVTYLNVF
jgi:hypothetical protein